MERLLLLRIVVENRRGFEFSFFFLKPIRKTRKFSEFKNFSDNYFRGQKIRFGWIISFDREL